MSIWKYVFDNDFLQRVDIEDLRSKQTKLQTSASVERRKLLLRVSELEEELGETAVVLRALKELMLEKGLCSEEDLKRKLSDLTEEATKEVPAKSGQQGSGKQLRLRKCAKCARILQRDRKKCMYCGHEPP
ncbi:MAG: hypothetical protein JJU29_01530 [Verrucomicrobia bacterium]|nr:hypothetical protein [Verrucomicrobiota bacterium]MCH8512004.1 hypothetical protein [Kiritimatiellia bacterium]